jgi:type II secretory pathway component PulJ
VPLQAETTFWVFPWQMMLAGLAIVALLGAGIWSMVSKIIRTSRKIGGRRHKIKL